MKIVVFGASNSLGQEIIAQAINLGHYVTAFVRSPEGLINKFSCNNLRIVRGNVLNYAAVERGIRGQGVVISAIVGESINKNKIMSEGTKNIIAAMNKFKVRKLICVSAIDLAEMRTRKNWLYRLMVMPFKVPGFLKDREIQERHIQNSELEWIIIKPGLMGDGPRRGVYNINHDGYNGNRRNPISRADVADLVLRQIHQASVARQIVEVSC